MANEANPYDQFDAKPADASAGSAAPDASITLSGRAVDVLRGVVGGSRDAIQGLTDTGLSGMQAISGAVNKVIGGNQAATDEAYRVLAKQITFSEAEQNQTALGSITREVVKWVVGMKAVGTVARAAGLAPTTTLGKAALTIGAEAPVAGFAFTDPHSENLGSLLDSVPSLHGPVTSFLAQNPNDSDSVNKLRGALENTVISGLVEPALIAFKAYRASSALRAAGKASEAEAALKAATPEIDSTLQQGMTTIVDLTAKPAAEVKMLPNAAEGATAKGLGPTAETPTVAQQATLRLSAEDKTTLLGSVQSTMQGVETGLGDASLSRDAINFKNIKTSQDGQNLLTDLASVVRDSLPNISPGTSMKLDHVTDLAKWVGAEPTSLYTTLSQTAAQVGAKGDAAKEMAAQLVAGKMAIKSTVDAMVTEAARIGSGISVDHAGFAHLADVLTTLMDNVAGIRTAAARTTAAGAIKINSGLTATSFADLLQSTSGGSEAIKALADRIRLADSIEGVTATVRGTPPSWFDKTITLWNHIWMNGVLGGFKTTVINVTSTALNTGLMPAYRYFGGMMMGDREQMAQAVYQYHFLRSAFGDALSMAKRSWLTGQAVLDAGSTSFGAAKDLRFNQNDAMAFLRPDTPEGALRSSVNWGVYLTGWSGRFLNAQDEFFKQLTYRSHMMASATADGIKQGLGGDALKSFVDQQLADSLGKAGQALDTKSPALLAARAATFTQDLNQAKWFGRKSLGEIMQDASNSNPVVKGFVLPFTKVPTNLGRQAMDMTPGLNLLRKQVQEDIAAGGERAATALGKMGVGTALWSAAGFAAYEGRITGGGPKDPDLQRQMREGGWLPYSIWYGTDSNGKKMYVSLQRLQPFSTFLGLVGDWADIHAHMGEDEKAQAAEQMVLAVMKNATNQTYLRGLTNVTDALMGDEKKLTNWLKSYAGSVVPSIVQTIQPDDELKSVRSVLDAVAAKIPGLASTVEAKRDNFGEKIMAPMGYPYNAINPFTYSKEPNDPVRRELASLAMTDTQAKFVLPSPTVGPAGQQIDLRDIKNPKTGQSAYDRLMELHSRMELGGKTLHERMADLIASPSYQQARDAMGTGDKLYRRSLAVDMLEREFQTAERLAKLQLEKEYPGLGAALRTYAIGLKTSRVEGSQTATPLSQLQELANQNGGQQ